MKDFFTDSKCHHSSCKTPFSYSEVSKETAINFIPSNEINLGNFSDLLFTKNLISNVNERVWSSARKDLNPYESPIQGYKNTVSRAYYKLWEILASHSSILNNRNSGYTLHICDAPGGFTSCVADYFEKYKGSNPIDEGIHYAVSLVDPDDHLVPSFKRQILENKKVSVINVENSDINKSSVANGIIKNIRTNTKNKGVYLITADGGIPDKGEYNTKENTHVELFFSEIFIALECLENKGVFVMKIFDVYTLETLSMIQLLYCFFGEICICKPDTSRPTNSEKYILCVGFEKEKYSKSRMKNKVARVYYGEDRLSNISNIHDFYIEKLVDYLITLNEDFKNNQIKNIIETLDFIKKGNHCMYNSRVANAKEVQKIWSKKYNF